MANKTFIGWDFSHKYTFWEKVRLLFVKRKWIKDGDHALFFKQMDGKIYVIDEKFTATQQVEGSKEK